MRIFSKLKTLLARFEPPPDPRRAIILADLESGPMSAGDLRHHLRSADEIMNVPQFYRFMAGMETDGLVKGYYISEVIVGMRFQERWYQKASRSDRESWQ
jgi:hypothetical protein